MNKALPLTKYHQIYLVLREQLQEGRFADGLPGELALARQFSVGRITVRRALEQLAADLREPSAIARATASDPKELNRQQAAVAQGSQGSGLAVQGNGQQEEEAAGRKHGQGD